MKFKGDIIIIDPCNVVRSDEDWQLCKWGADMAALGVCQALYIDAGDEYGCKVINADSNEVIGRFCTDSCALIVTYLEDILKYNPEFHDHISWPDSNAVIKGFDGEVVVDTDNFEIVGRGNLNFRTVEE